MTAPKIDTQELRDLLGKVTPGPWEADSEYTFSSVTTKAEGLKAGRTHGYGCENDFICDLNDGEYHEYTDADEQAANARLIALAPQIGAALLAERDLSAAREAAAAMAMRKDVLRILTHLNATAGINQDGAYYVSEEAALFMGSVMGDAEDQVAALPLPDPAALDRLIAERVRDAVEAEREACAKIAEAETGWKGQPHVSQMEYGPGIGSRIAAKLRARGSKEGRDG